MNAAYAAADIRRASFCRAAEYRPGELFLMPHRFCQLVALTTLVTVQLSSQLKGQETDSATRAGLLGRAYAEAQALYYDSPEPPGLVYDSTTGVTEH